MGPQKALETIGANLQKQYENWQPRVSVWLFLGFPAVEPGQSLLQGWSLCSPEPGAPGWLFSEVFLSVFMSWSIYGRY